MPPVKSINKSLRKLAVIDRERRNRAAMRVYNGAEEEQTFRFQAQPFVLKPGVNEIRDIYGVPIEVAREMRKKKQYERDGHVPAKTELIATAMEIAAHAESRLGERGVTVLSDDEEADAVAMKAARETWIKAKAAEERAIVDQYNRRTLAFHQDPRNKGAMPPPMTEREVAAEIWLSRYETGAMTLKKHVCPFKDGFHTDDASALDVHMAARHANHTLDAPNHTPAPEKRKPGRPRKNAEEAAAS